MSQDPRPRCAPENAAWVDRIRELRLAGHSLDDARTRAGPMPGRDPDLDELASKIAYGVLLAAFAEFGFTDTAYAAAFAAVALSDAFEEESHAPVHDQQ